MLANGGTVIEYAIKHVDNDRVFHMRSLHEAINALKLQDFPDHWQIVERHIGKWEEVSA